jgi:hypothetical protein
VLASCGDSDSRYGAARAALQAGELRLADARARESTDARASFLRGNIAFAQSLQAEQQATTMGSEPFAWDVAIQYIDRALDHWTRAALSRADWPAARRNVERALLKREDLRRKKKEAEKELERQSEAQPRPQPQPEAKPTGGEEKITEEAQIEAQLTPLSDGEVVRLLDRLVEKEKEKRDLRRSEGDKRLAEGELGW